MLCLTVLHPGQRPSRKDPYSIQPFSLSAKHRCDDHVMGRRRSDGVGDPSVFVLLVLVNE